MTDVTYKARFTKNMGNFESLQVEIGVTDSLRGGEKANDAYLRLQEFVDSRLIQRVQELDEEMRKAGIGG